jgi:hypothetical protein
MMSLSITKFNLKTLLKLFIMVGKAKMPHQLSLISELIKISIIK